MTATTKPDYPTDLGFASAAWLLMCDEPAIRAVAAVESGNSGAFLDTGEPALLYEPHIFHRLTEGRFDGRQAADLKSGWSELSYPKWRPGTYGPVAIQHTKLQAAARLDRDAALQACSWGLFQILGTNYRAAGYSSIQRFVTAAYRSADDHLRMFVMFLRSDARLVDAIRAHEWAAFAGVYNGPGFAANRYDIKLKAAFDKFQGEIAP